MKRIVLAICLLLSISPPCLGWLNPGDPDVDVVLNTEDNQFAFYNGPTGQSEWLLNNGARTSIRLKGYDDPSAMKWDLSIYAGEVIEEAELHLCLTSGSVINALVVSTINGDWIEGTKWGATAGAGEPCWRWRRYPDGEWTYIGSDFSTASFGNFGTLVDFGYKSDDAFKQYSSGGRDWVAMKLAPAIVYAMILDNFGLVATDPRFGSENGNPRVYSSEQGAEVQPRLYIKTAANADVDPPMGVTNLKARPGDWNGEAALRFQAPEDPEDGRAFGYDVRYSLDDDFHGADPVDRWRIPRPGEAGSMDGLLIENLIPGATYNFWVQSYDKVGNAGPAVMTSLTLPPAIPDPVLPDGGFPTPDPTGKSIRGVPSVLNYWACSELAKVNPAGGNRMEDGYTGPPDDAYKKANPVWDSAANTVTLRPARNQVIGFQVIVQRLISSLTGVSLSAGDLTGPGGATIPAADNIEFFKLHHVGSGALYPDPAIPLSPPFDSTLDIPDPDNNPGGVHQSVWCDIYVPRDATPGTYTGLLTLSCDQLASPVAIQLQMIVACPRIPDKPTFFLDLNGYGAKWDGEASRHQVFQLCHKHRVTPNTLPYGWSETWRPDRAPTLTGTGPAAAVDSWTVFATTYGPFFDGSAFSPTHPAYPYHGPGENTPIANFYTTGFEGWPVSISDGVYGYDADGMGHAYWNSLVDSGESSIRTFWREAPDVLRAFPDGYAAGARNVWKEFAEFARANNWGTAFQFYLNNKRGYSGSSSLWTLEEQYVADDFRADAWFMGLCRQGWERGGGTDADFHWRIDASTRWQQNWGQLKGICNLRVQGDGNAWDYRHDRYRRYTEQLDEMRWWYGTGPARTDSLTDHGAEILTHWSHGLDGGLPYWNNYDDNWTTASGEAGGEDATLSVLLSGDDVPGHGAFDGRIATIRMKAMRHGQQLCELLNILSASEGWSRNLAARALGAGRGDHSGMGYDAYGGDEYNGVSILGFHQLHADLVAAISGGEGVHYIREPSGNCNGRTPCHPTIQDALDEIEASGECRTNIIKVVEGDYGEIGSLTEERDVVLKCGYEDADYLANPYDSAIGKLIIEKGAVTVEGLVIGDW